MSSDARPPRGGRPLTGKVVEHSGSDGLTYRALRFTAYGKRRYISLGAVSEADAERELRHVLADIERGIWRPPREVELPEPKKVLPSFHEYAEQWWLRHAARLAEITRTDYRWRLESHLLPYFGEMRLEEIDIDAVEDYIAMKLTAMPPLAPRSINMTATLLALILETAVERRLIDRNPAVGRQRRVRERVPRRSYLESAVQIRALLEAADELDQEAPPGARHIKRKAMIATLTFAGLRISELCALAQADVDLTRDWINVHGSKTDASVRSIKVRPVLHRELAGVCAAEGQKRPGGYLFATATGNRFSDDNFRNRVLKKVVERANSNLDRMERPGWSGCSARMAGGLRICVGCRV
ncbi:MAG: tyrosine-type recombinase/integrase [Solirubrobacteraceae bacterium]